MTQRRSSFTETSGSPKDPLEMWAMSVMRRAVSREFTGLDMKWVQFGFESRSDGGVRERERQASLESLAAAWGRSSPDAPMPEAATRRGDGVRAGIVGTDSHWASSLSHSVPAQAVAAVVIRGRSRVGVGSRKGRKGGQTRLSPAFKPRRGESVPGVPELPSSFPAVGIDIEPAERKLHPRMAGKLRPRPEAEAPGVDCIPLLAVWCVKEAIYKSDRFQAGRIIADYDWVRARKWSVVPTGWTGWAQARGESVPRFAVAVRLEGNCWVAMALSFSKGPLGR